MEISQARGGDAPLVDVAGFIDAQPVGEFQLKQLLISHVVLKALAGQQIVG